MKAAAILLALLPLCVSAPVSADALDDIMEKARAKGGEYARVRQILNEEPDQNVRLAAFNYIVASDDPTMKAIAIDAGLASTDRILQSQAFLAAVMDLEAIHLTLSDKDGVNGKKPKNLVNYINSYGASYIVKITERDLSTGTFTGGHNAGEVTGILLNVTDSYWNASATLELLDDDKVQGEFLMYGYTMIATGKLR